MEQENAQTTVHRRAEGLLLCVSTVDRFAAAERLWRI